MCLYGVGWRVGLLKSAADGLVGRDGVERPLQALTILQRTYIKHASICRIVKTEEFYRFWLLYSETSNLAKLRRKLGERASGLRRDRRLNVGLVVLSTKFTFLI
jgi:hypothetical protein